MTKVPRALALIRRMANIENLYEAWLYHSPAIRSLGIGVRQTKDLLQSTANGSKEFPIREVSPADIEKALATKGREVMIYYLTQGEPTRAMPEPRESDDVLDYEGETGTVAPLPVPPPDVIVSPIPPLPPLPPLPPILEPPDMATDERLACISMIDAEYQRMLARVLVPEPKVEVVPWSPSASRDAKIRAESYKKITTQFASSCDYVVQAMVQEFGKFK
jgi:hypothetical protein